MARVPRRASPTSTGARTGRGQWPLTERKGTVTFTDGQKPDRATFTDRVAYVWDTATGRDVLHLRGHDDKVASARFSPDGSKIVTASWDETARIWDAATGKELHVLRGHTRSLPRPCSARTAGGC